MSFSLCASSCQPWIQRLSAGLLALALSACTASTQLVRNDHVSQEVKAKGLHAYHQIILIPPREDPRKVVPRAVAEFESMGFEVKLVDPEKPFEPGQGTGFLISSDGLLLTCAHVLGDETAATVTLNGVRHYADVVKSDKDADLVLLRLRDPLPAGTPALSFRGPGHDYSMGEDVYTIGYPLSRLLGNGARMSKGLLSATSGLHDDPKQVQVSAEIQPGNSGGPLLDHEGQVIGVIQQTMNPWSVVQATGGALPQNINFSIKNDPVFEFLKAASADAKSPAALDQGGGLDRASHAVAKIQAGIVDDSNHDSKMVVRLFYISMWDMWYRFRAFVLTAFDFDSQEVLFAAGQGRDNLVSNEDVVIKDTFGQFRRAIAAP